MNLISIIKFRIRKKSILLTTLSFIFLIVIFLNQNYENIKTKISEKEKDVEKLNLKLLSELNLNNVTQWKFVEINAATQSKRETHQIKQDSIYKDKYLIDINKNRLNRLLKKLYDKEIVFESLKNQLNLISFSDLINEKSSTKAHNNTNKYKVEINHFFDINNNQILVKDEFITYLYNKSEYYSFLHPRKDFPKSKVPSEKPKPVIITAANSNYYDALQSTVYHIHQNFPDYELIIYDLGLNGEMIDKAFKKCKCKIRKFDSNGVYAKVSPHISDLHTYSWKPLIIQETLKEYDSLIYIDSSVRFHSNQIEPIIDSCKDVGMLTQFIQLELLCYTNPKMFDWFEENPKDFSQFYTIEANILMFHKSFLTSLIMKAWVTCALDKDCIAPPGSSTGGCCGCHRYDQDAITIVNSFFYGHPKESKNYLPAYSFTTYESFFFEIRRYEGMKYFDKK